MKLQSLEMPPAPCLWGKENLAPRPAAPPRHSASSEQLPLFSVFKLSQLCPSLSLLSILLPPLLRQGTWLPMGAFPGTEPQGTGSWRLLHLALPWGPSFRTSARLKHVLAMLGTTRVVSGPLVLLLRRIGQPGSTHQALLRLVQSAHGPQVLSMENRHH